MSDESEPLATSAREVAVGVDGTPSGDTALEWANMFAERTAAALRIVSVVDVGIAGAISPAYADARARAVSSVLEHAHASSLVPAVTVSREFGRVVPGLIAQSRNAAAVVIGTDKTGVIAGLIHGTVPLKLAGTTEVPLIVVPTTWQRSGGPIVIAVDESTDDRAIRFAADTAVAFGEHLVLVHVWGVAPLVLADPEQLRRLTAELEATARRVLDSVEARLSTTHPRLAMTKVLVDGEPSLAVVEAVRSTPGAQLIVIGTRRLGPVGSLLLGSVGHDLLMNMPCPVAVVPPTHVRSTHLPPTHLPPIHTPQTDKEN